jgi:hypothetical protein
VLVWSRAQSNETQTAVRCDGRADGARSRDSGWLTSFFDFALGSTDFLLLDAGSVWVEAAELLCLFPSKNAVGTRFILGCRHYIFFNGGKVCEVCAGSRWASVDNL